ncbi:hypothetical protein Tco_1375566 [Tanacetum coccineum]
MEAHYINLELKFQNQVLKLGQHGRLLNETSNEAKIKREINILETINIELENSVAKLLAENEKLHKENEHLKQTYKDLYDSIKKTQVQTKDLNDLLIALVNSKTIENADLKAQIQEKFASQVDVNNDFPKPVTHHYLPKVREFVLAKPHYVIVPGSSRNNSKESYGSIDMAHNYYLEEAKKKTQDKNRNLKAREMPSARTHHTPNACRIFNTVDLRWVPTGKTFTSSTTMVDCEPLNGSNKDITNPYESNQTLNVSACTLNLSAGPVPQRKQKCTIQCALSSNEEKSSCVLPSSNGRMVIMASEQSSLELAPHDMTPSHPVHDSFQTLLLQHRLYHHQGMNGILCFNECLMSSSLFQLALPL